MEEEHYCIGHVIARSSNCYLCTKDDLNQNCPNYKDITVHLIEVEEDLRNKILVGLETKT